MRLWRYGHEIERLGQRYRLERPLGSGGMADVCLAWDEKEECDVAIKVIKPDALDQKTLDRFLKEAAQVAKWNHPHILRVYGDVKWELLDAAHGSVVPYIVMEYAQGGDLQKRLKAEQLYPLEETLRIFSQLCSTVQYAHDDGIIHRDLKPSNILFRVLPDGSEQLVLSDFGLAVHVDATHISMAHAGTMAYMAPEQLQGQPKPASDIFALGVILYRLCTGKLPFPRSLQLIPLPSDLNPALPKELDNIILKALAEDPKERFASASLFREAADITVAVSSVQPPASLSKKEKGDASPPAASSAQEPDVALQNAQQDENTGKFPVVSVRPPPTLQPGAHLHVSVVQLTPPPVSPTPRQRNTGQMAAVGAGTTRRASGGLGGPLTKAGVGGRGAPSAGGPHGRSGWRWVLAITLILLVLLLVFGGIAYAAPGIFGLAGILPGTSSTATVIITLAHKDLKNTYVITGVTGTPDTSQRQVQARLLSSNTPPQSKTVNATGVKQAQATQATGMLTFLNGNGIAYTVAAGTSFTDSQGVSVVTDGVAVIPAAHPPEDGSVTVSAHAVNGGTSGNIAALDFNNVVCCASSAVFVSNTTAFTGGQDPQNYTFVQQSDIDGAANPLVRPLTQSAQMDLQKQIHRGEKLVSPAQCTSKVTSDHAAGDKATTVTVTVSAKCTCEVYDQQGALSMGMNLLKTQAMTDPGAGYALVGNLVTGVTQATVIDTKDTVSLLVKAEGVWAYQFSDARKHDLAKLIAGKSKKDAQAKLLQQTGVSQVNINISAGGNTLPTDSGQITILVQNIPGLSGTATPATGPSTPTTPGSTPPSKGTPTPVVDGGH